MFSDRAEAGRQLARALLHLKGKSPLVLALPRGGVPVGFEVARELDAHLDLMLVRKIGAPGHEEYGIGAVCDGPEPVVVLDEGVISLLGVPASYVDAEKTRQLAEIERRRRMWLAGRPSADIQGRTVILVDDGIATGGTMRAALQAVRRRQPRRLVLAVPVAAPETLELLRSEADETVCLLSPEWFNAVGTFYAEFHQLEDCEVSDLLARAEEFG